MNYLIQLKEIIADLEKEKYLLQSELEKLMSNRFTTNRVDEYEAEIEKLKAELKKYKDLWSTNEAERVRWEQNSFDNSGLF